MRKVIVLGSTGSIGTQGLDVISQFPGEYSILALGAGGGNTELLAQQAATFAVPVVGIANASGVNTFRDYWNEMYPEQPCPEIFAGPEAMTDLAKLGDAQSVVLNGITGSIGLKPTLAALESNATLALANKESLVAGGALVAQAMQRPAQIVPVDSEHSAIYQALRSGRHNRGLTAENIDGTTEVRRLILTASGGPFFGKTRSDLTKVTPEEALNHPTWAMGPVVTINSSTLMNKALELIEAAILFDISPKDIVPVVHRQSVIHSMVEFVDGSTIAQASPPDMKLPIALGLSAPVRFAGISVPCAWDAPVQWTFEPVDHETFPALRLAQTALETSSLHPAVLNAANEEGVQAFISGRLGYLEIIEIVEKVLHEFSTAPSFSGANLTAQTLHLETVLEAESWARVTANTLISQRG
ncbi:MAG: 1-deoxy-D-xylulose-5-phosphate reductoisomerase [Arcanobacterium sp.]|nr:1-deoxy-D-xylulose-5-phosphate reductoisomerase [Arcanobacterium sp.]